MENGMLLKQQAQRLFELALAEFAPDWDVVGPCTELSPQDPGHWVSGTGSFGFTIRHRLTRSTKTLGRHTAEPGVACHRGVSYRILEAYADRITDPIRRYLEEVGLLRPSEAASWAPPRARSGLGPR